jgi:hypothetical protein
VSAPAQTRDPFGRFEQVAHSAPEAGLPAAPDPDAFEATIADFLTGSAPGHGYTDLDGDAIDRAAAAAVAALTFAA